MGVILSVFAAASHSIKKSRDKRKARKASKLQQPFSSAQEEEQAVHEAQLALRDEHLASVPPPSAGAGSDTKEGERRVGVQAPGLLATTSTSNQNTELEEGAKKDKMASDEDYASFLDKANQDPNEGIVKTQSSGKVQLKAVDKGAEVPTALRKATKDAFYVSDADEPFEPVYLNYDGKALPDEAAFAKLVNHPSPKDADVSIMDIGEWDTQGQYKELVDATREVSKGSDVRVYRVAKDGSRAEYWVVGVQGGKLVGVKALAVES